MTNPNMTPSTVPFKLMRGTLKSLQALALVTMAATDIHKTQPLLAAKVFAIRDKTTVLQNPLRKEMLVHLVAWYMVIQELAEAVKESHPDVARSINQGLMRSAWLAKIVDGYEKVKA